MDKKVILQRLGILLAYPLAYAYVRLVFNFDDISKMGISILDGSMTIAVTYPVFAILFIIVNELIRRSRRGVMSRPSKETVFWYAAADVICFFEYFNDCFEH